MMTSPRAWSAHWGTPETVGQDDITEGLERALGGPKEPWISQETWGGDPGTWGDPEPRIWGEPGVLGESGEIWGGRLPRLPLYIQLPINRPQRPLC